MNRKKTVEENLCYQHPLEGGERLLCLFLWFFYYFASLIVVKLRNHLLLFLAFRVTKCCTAQSDLQVFVP